ncbi:hypothetical protein [Bradyrhizobium sp. AZCC 1610]|uniref:hypothetical protein n=1 Tax=Bradyrhizobium sp. AZCC 1610 TaxID=3117020 RepID=UPI002FF2FBDD
MHYGPKLKPLSGAAEEIFQGSPELLKMHRERMAMRALSLEPMKSVLFPDGKGGLREEAVPADFKDPFREAMVRAFRHFKLDPNDPFSWRVMVEYFAYIFFWQHSGRRGGKTKWTADREAQLLKAVQSLPMLSDMKTAYKLANDKNSPFYVKGVVPSDGVNGLRRRIGKVRKKLATN